MKVTYWGTRGSTPAPSVRSRGFYTDRYGGNTSCVEISVPGTQLILDAGTGIRELGAYMAGNGIKAANILLSHSHWDHIQGFPFFVPGYLPGNWLRVFGQEKDFLVMRRVEPTTKQTFEHQQVQPYFPVPLESMNAQMEFNDVLPGDSFDLDGVRITTRELNHPNGYLGFRLEHNGKIVAYASDNEPDGRELTDNLIELARGADLFIQDAQYTPEEYAGKKGWGHSTYEHAIDSAVKAGAKKLALFHHEPVHDDRQLDAILKRAHDYLPKALDLYKGSGLEIAMAEEGASEPV
jgi:phosphoribosyl 1,2-cyclic phosphodiesterase